MTVKVFLTEDEIPKQWYNLAADLPSPLLPPLGPDGNPVSPDMLAPVFPMNLIEQEVSQAETAVHTAEQQLTAHQAERQTLLDRQTEVERRVRHWCRMPSAPGRSCSRRRPVHWP